MYDQVLVTGAWDGSVKVWRINGAHFECVHSFTDHTAGMFSKNIVIDYNFFVKHAESSSLYLLFFLATIPGIAVLCLAFNGGRCCVTGTIYM